MTTSEDASVEAQESGKDEFPELVPAETARPGDVTPPMDTTEPYVYPPGDANAPHADTEPGEKRAKAGDSRGLGELYGQREEQQRVLEEAELPEEEA